MNPDDMIPGGFTLDAVFGGIAGLLGNSAILGILGIVIAWGVGPVIFRRLSRMASSDGVDYKGRSYGKDHANGMSRRPMGYRNGKMRYTSSSMFQTSDDGYVRGRKKSRVDNRNFGSGGPAYRPRRKK